MADASQNQGQSSAVPPSGPANPPPIRTMKDDLASPTAAPVSPPATQALDISANRPLSSSPLSSEQPVLTGQLRKKHTGLIITITILLFAAAVGVGAWFYFSGNNNATAPIAVVTPPPTNATILDVIPATSNVVLHYNLAQTTFRERLSRAWEGQSGDTPLANLLSGNPSHLLFQGDVSQIAYVSLPNDPRPYLIVPKSASTDQLVAQHTEEQAIEINGWYVLHPLSVANYTAALGQGNMAEISNIQPLSADYPLHFIASTQFITNSHQDLRLVYPNFEPGQHIILNGQVSGTGQVVLLTNDNLLAGIGNDTNNNLNSGTNNLYQHVPSDATFVWQGQDASDDLTILANARGLVIDDTVLQKLPVDTFIKKLQAPYIYYERLGADSVKDIGLVIALPETLRTGETAIQLGDQDIESALQAFIPRITGQSAAGSLAFNDGSYNNVDLKFVNLVGTTQALDYALYDGLLIMATSKEGILRVIDTIIGNTTNIEEDSSWSTLIVENNRLPRGRVQVLSEISDPLLAKILPLGQDDIPVIAQSGFLETSPLRLDAALGWAEGSTILTPSATPERDSAPTPSDIISP